MITECYYCMLFGQVSTLTGRYQLPIFRCTNVHQRRYARPLFRRPVYWWRHETQYAHNIVLFSSPHQVYGRLLLVPVRRGFEESVPDVRISDNFTRGYSQRTVPLGSVARIGLSYFRQSFLAESTTTRYHFVVLTDCIDQCFSNGVPGDPRCNLFSDLRLYSL